MYFRWEESFTGQVVSGPRRPAEPRFRVQAPGVPSPGRRA